VGAFAAIGCIHSKLHLAIENIKDRRVASSGLTEIESRCDLPVAREERKLTGLLGKVRGQKL
jgi:hypothetical protein